MVTLSLSRGQRGNKHLKVIAYGWKYCRTERIFYSFGITEVEKSGRKLENEGCVCVCVCVRMCVHAFLENKALAKFTGAVNHFFSL